MFEGNFGQFIRWAVEKSRYDGFAVKYFCYNTRGYIFEDDLEAFETQLQNGYFDVLQNIENAK